MALEAGGLTLQQFAAWPEKKKVELWVEPEDWPVIKVRDIFTVIEREKKKVELEKFPGYEVWRDPMDFIVKSGTYDRLIKQIVTDVKAQLNL